MIFFRAFVEISLVTTTHVADEMFPSIVEILEVSLIYIMFLSIIYLETINFMLLFAIRNTYMSRRENVTKKLVIHVSSLGMQGIPSNLCV